MSPTEKRPSPVLSPGGTYGPGDTAAPARRDRFRTDQYIPGPDPSFANPADAGHEAVEELAKRSG